MTIVRDFDHWAGMQGAGRWYGDPALHRSNSSVSRTAWKAAVDNQAALDSALTERRAIMRVEFARLVAAGEIREMTTSEYLLDRAQGHPDNEAVQAARRILARRGGRIHGTSDNINSHSLC